MAGKNGGFGEEFGYCSINNSGSDLNVSFHFGQSLQAGRFFECIKRYYLNRQLQKILSG
jgi:hypothetical protein